MAQLTIYLDPETQRKVTAAAKREKRSMSAWAREQLTKAAEGSSGSAWDHLRAFAGTFVGADAFEPPPRSKVHRPIPPLE
jgi:plasmid stability protein